jgi:FkbM family methyltransferase
MKIRPLVKQMINRPLGMLGLKLVRAGAGQPRRWRTPTYADRLQHMKTLGFAPRIIFDCGAYWGGWTQNVSRFFPGAQFLLVEPNPLVYDRIRASIVAIEPKPILIEGAVGESAGKVQFNVWEDSGNSRMSGSSLLTHRQIEPAQQIEVPLYTIDALAEEYHLIPDMIKLDLQGFELPALKQANHVLETAELVIVEFGCWDAYIGRTTPREIMDFLYDRGYRLYDVVDLIYRPYDGALGAGDFFFIKETSPMRRYQGYA